ncbi:SDR family NAD(P)-dependent oxidoreductase [Hufsiella ginkgonis]|uniref:SDR family oxidoreductase n=1 Tax=Hufsiella ginkgonis TaxID=2695274 RepID=A0A7K1Y204_9SPHI|nr:SDR family oxidoreductase [Hufsiella ginkgonis]MXV17261.1 SDR family oxidoreductase [Hufsiella ginkgonis]
MTFDFSGKTVLITGGSRGIGAATARLFARWGATVVFTYRSGEEAAKATLASLGAANHAMYRLNVADPAGVQQFFAVFAARYQKADILVNNAGIFTEHKILDTGYNDWLQNWNNTLQTNLTGAANMCYFASRLMVEHGGGKIINISSRGAFRGEPDHPAYGASKAGLNAMSQSLAIALAPHNISVHVIAPGFVETEMAAETLEGPSGDLIKNQSPFGRVARPEEVAGLVAVYASNGLEFTSGGIADLNGASYLRS